MFVLGTFSWTWPWIWRLNIFLNFRKYLCTSSIFLTSQSVARRSSRLQRKGAAKRIICFTSSHNHHHHHHHHHNHHIHACSPMQWVIIIIWNLLQTYQTQVRSYYSSIFLNWTDSRLLQDWATSFPFIEPESNHCCLPLPQTFVDLNYLTWIEVTNSRSKGNRLLFQRLQVHWKSFPLPFNFMSMLLKLPFF